MPNISRVRSLGFREQALVALAVLLDGHDAADYLTSDRDRSTALSRAAKDLAELAPEVRLPLCGTLLRQSIKKINEQGLR